MTSTFVEFGVVIIFNRFISFMEKLSAYFVFTRFPANEMIISQLVKLCCIQNAFFYVRELQNKLQ